MGLPDDYKLPTNYNDAYGLMGDGVAVSVVQFLAHWLIEPLMNVKTTSYRIPAHGVAQLAPQS